MNSSGIQYSKLLQSHSCAGNKIDCANTAHIHISYSVFNMQMLYKWAWALGGAVIAFVYIAHLKTTGVDPKGFPIGADGVGSVSIQVHTIKEIKGAL